MKNNTNLQDVLKLLAICSMIIDHLAEYILKYYIPLEQILILRGLGRFAMPIFCFFTGYNNKNSLSIYNWGIAVELVNVLNKYYYYYIQINNITPHVRLFLFYSAIIALVISSIFVLNKKLTNLLVTLKTELILSSFLIIFAYFVSRATDAPVNILISIYLGKTFVHLIDKYLDNYLAVSTIYLLLSLAIIMSYKIIDYGSLSILFVITGRLSQLSVKGRIIYSTYCCFLLLNLNKPFFSNHGSFYFMLNIYIHIISWLALNAINYDKVISNQFSFVHYISRRALFIYVLHIIIFYLCNLAIKLHLI